MKFKINQHTIIDFLVIILTLGLFYWIKSVGFSYRFGDSNAYFYMADQFLHGVKVLELTDGVRPVRTVKSSVIGIVGTAPFADAAPEAADPLEAEEGGLDAEGEWIHATLREGGALSAVIRVALE